MKEQIKVIGNGNGNGSINIYSPKKVAEVLEVKESFAKRLLREGNLKGFKVGRFWRVTQEALDDYCASCGENGNGKRKVSKDFKNKIRFHANLRSQDTLPNAVERSTGNVAEIKETMQGENGFKKVALIAKLRSAVTLREELCGKLENLDVSLSDLGNKAYPELIALVDKDPDSLEEIFANAAKNSQKKMVDLLDKKLLEELSKGEAKQVQEEQAVGELNLADA